VASPATLIAPDETRSARSCPLSIILYTVARQTRSRFATSGTVRKAQFNSGCCVQNVNQPLEIGLPGVTG